MGSTAGADRHGRFRQVRAHPLLCLLRIGIYHCKPGVRRPQPDVAPPPPEPEEQVRLIGDPGLPAADGRGLPAELDDRPATRRVLPRRLVNVGVSIGRRVAATPTLANWNAARWRPLSDAGSWQTCPESR